MPRRSPQKLLTGILIFLIACSPLQQATLRPPGPPPGTPLSLEFGYGTRLDINDPHLETSLRLTAQHGLNWVALDFDWEAVQPAPDAWNHRSSLSEALRLAHSLGLNTLVSIKNPPDWALSVDGPGAKYTIELVSRLLHADWPATAIELFPGANTSAGWKATPNAIAYASLYQQVQAHLEAEHHKVYLVAGGLSNRLLSTEDLPDVDFLGQLYTAGLRPAIISLGLHAINGDVFSPPAVDVLRHYEELRAVMISHQHKDGLLWITDFYLSAEIQAEPWLKQAYPMMKSQLYLGAVFCPQAYLAAYPKMFMLWLQTGQESN